MWTQRTDLAVEAQELWRESAAEQTKLDGVEAVTRDHDGFTVTTVKILDDSGARALGKPVGTYVTMELDKFIHREDNAFSLGAMTLSCEISGILSMSPGDTVLVVGLGNNAITADSIGPAAVKHTMVTRHLVDRIPEAFGHMRTVSVLESGVLGTTGIESADFIKAVADKLRPDRVIVIDALASRRLGKLCRTVQLSDAGIVPGSGVGNSRAAINSTTLGVPVMAIGVPTVVDAATLAADLASNAGVNMDPEDFKTHGGDMIVTPKEIDTNVSDISKLIGYALNLALHKGLTVDDITMFLG